MTSLHKSALLLVITLLISSCGGYYKASHFSSSNSQEQIKFFGAGYDAFYGSHNLMPTWSIIYPSSARNSSTNTVQAKDFTAFSGDKDARLDSLTGYIIVDPESKVDARLVRKLYRRDGSSYIAELPFNGSYRLIPTKSKKMNKSHQTNR